MAVASFVPRGIGRVPGYAPGSAVTFFGQKKSPKMALPAVCDPFAARRGNLRWGIHKGFGNPTGHRCARPPVGAPFQPSPGGEGANTGPSAAMARVDVWFLFFGFQSPCVRAEERSARGGWGCRRTPPTSTSDLPQLFERSAQREVSSAARPAREHHRLPRAQHGDTDSRAGVLW